MPESHPHRNMFLLLAISGMLRMVYGFATGLVTASCGSMIPIHNRVAQNTTAPYIVLTNQSVYAPGASVMVTLQANSSVFTGFLLQAWEVDGNTTVGIFTVGANTSQLLNCSGSSNSAVSHTSASRKSSLNATWTAPQTGRFKDIQFRATFVRNYSLFWVQVKSSVVTYNGTGASATSANLSISSAGCGQTKFCVSQPVNCNPATSTSCYFTSVQPSPTSSTAFQIEIVGPAPGYVSMGFSDDRLMGNDDVYICGLDANGLVQVQHAFNRGAYAPNILNLGNIFNIQTSLQNGIISCTFTSQNSISTQRSSGISSLYFLLFAAGPSSGGIIQLHTKSFSSDQMVNISIPWSVITGLPSGQPSFVKAHGCLMLIAWMTTGTLGMMIARYMKGATKGHSYFNKDLWFLLHVGLMSLSVAATSIAFIVIFSCVQEWSGGAHAVLGCLVMILSLIQPIAAAFRCAPQHKWRFIFYWGHALNALVIKVLAIAAIFTGLALIDTTANLWLQKVMGGFVGWEALFYVINEFYFQCVEKEQGEDSSGSVYAEMILLILFIIGNLAFLVALLCGIGLS